MRSLAIACGLLLAACSTTAEPPADPIVRVAHVDLDLSGPAGEDALVERVRRAVADYCRDHAAIATPHHRRAEPSFCLDGMRAEVVRAMSPIVRAAYDRGWARGDRRPR